MHVASIGIVVKTVEIYTQDRTLLKGWWHGTRMLLMRVHRTTILLRAIYFREIVHATFRLQAGARVEHCRRKEEHRCTRRRGRQQTLAYSSLNVRLHGFLFQAKAAARLIAQPRWSSILICLRPGGAKVRRTNQLLIDGWIRYGSRVSRANTTAR